MHPNQVDHARERRLRFVFNSAVVSYDLAADVTFGDIAQTLGELSNRRYGHPVAIDVTVGSREVGLVSHV